MSERRTSDPGSDPPHDKSVSSIPLETEDGDTVVIEQQNAGPGNQVGRGEFKSPTQGPTPEDAAAEQDELEAERPAP